MKKEKDVTVDFEAIFREALPSLKTLLEIPSVYEEKSVAEGMPYGKPVHDALLFMEDLARRDGFEVLDFDGYAAACCFGSGKKRIDVVSHLDVVEPGIGWREDPFCAYIADGRLYGRGTQDMKVSAFLTYLAFCTLKEQGMMPANELRLVFGCDEERTMEDILYYLKKAGQPEFAFTPDGRFPMAIGEKGALMWRLHGDYEGIVISLDAGVQCNVVSPVAKAALKGTGYREKLTEFFRQEGIDGTIDEKTSVIESVTLIEIHGKAAHASLPELGRSATVDLLKSLSYLGDSFFEGLYSCFADPYGTGAGIAAQVKGKEELTLNLGVFRIQDGSCYGEVDCRYPYGVSSGVCTRQLEKVCPLFVSLDYDSAPVLADEEDPYIKALLAAYREKTGDRSQPFISGGVSYSKVYDHCVAYGPMRQEDEMLAHQANENIPIERCIEAFEIYYEAIKKLAFI